MGEYLPRPVSSQELIPFLFQRGITEIDPTFAVPVFSQKTVLQLIPYSILVDKLKKSSTFFMPGLIEEIISPYCDLNEHSWKGLLQNRDWYTWADQHKSRVLSPFPDRKPAVNCYQLTRPPGPVFFKPLTYGNQTGLYVDMIDNHFFGGITSPPVIGMVRLDDPLTHAPDTEAGYFFIFDRHLEHIDLLPENKAPFCIYARASGLDQYELEKIWMAGSGHDL